MMVYWTINDKQKYRPRRTASVSYMHQFVGQFIHMFHFTWHLGTQTKKCFKHQFTFWRYWWANSSIKFTPFWISSNTQLSAFQIHSHKFIQYVFKRLSHTSKESKRINAFETPKPILNYACTFMSCSKFNKISFDQFLLKHSTFIWLSNFLNRENPLNPFAYSLSYTWKWN